ncbi:MAG: NAD(P)H-dependent oxidoreductase subunit E, partial [Vicinamibacterales bacterium]|nr:NAD(P)H-dependent oxidoreductase subunit E [Vicinamibacterales bacterium]
MSRARWVAHARSWLGIVAAAVVVASAVWLVSEYLYALRITPVEQAIIAELKEQARTDAAIPRLITAEFERQHLRIVRRREAYRFGALALLIAAGVLVAWFRWLRPADGAWVGVPAAVVRVLAAPRDGPRLVAPPPRAGDMGPEGSGKPLIALPLRTTAPAGTQALDLGAIETILQATGTRRDAILPVLQAIQARYRFLPEAALRRVCEASDIGPAQLAGVASFYGQFRLTPTGEHIIRVCEGTACHVSGAVDVRTELRRCLGMSDGADTDPTG